MPFETLQKGLGEEAEPDWVQFQSFVFVHRVLLHLDVECFLDFPLQTVTFAIDHFHVVEIKALGHAVRRSHAQQQHTCQIVRLLRRTRGP